jgi:acetyl esterase/lipase
MMTLVHLGHWLSSVDGGRRPVGMEQVGLVAELDPGVRGITPRPAYTDLTYVQPIVSEDCLYLDIWVPEETGDAPLPVYVYYHGGANTGSSGSFVRERGANFARDANVIVVPAELPHGSPWMGSLRLAG